jgi:hypothetical protein
MIGICTVGDGVTVGLWDCVVPASGVLSALAWDLAGGDEHADHNMIMTIKSTPSTTARRRQ